MKTIILKQGDWNKYKKSIVSVENKCFNKSEQTENEIYKKVINDIELFTILIFNETKPIACLICSNLENCGDDLKRWDKHFGKHNTLYVISIGVIPQYQSCGIGHILMKIMLSRASKKYDRISLHTRNKNFKNLCIQYGFRIVKTGFMDNHKMKYMVKNLR